MKIINPATGEQITDIVSDSQASIQKKYLNARQSQPSWAKISLADKKKMMSQFSSLCLENIDRLAMDLSLEVGKPIQQAKGEIEANLKRVQFFVDHIDSTLKTEEVYSETGLQEKISYEALGVVGNISAWNFPYFVSTNVVIPALLTGNTVLFKPSEFASLSGRNMVELLHKSGVPSDVLNLIIGDGKIGAHLLDQKLDGLFFTGSYATGKKIYEKLAGHMCRVQLELGGKDPSYICDDMDPRMVAPMVGDGCFYNAGQSCCAVERLYVHEKIYDDFIIELTKFAKSLSVGDPLKEDTYLGPLTRKAQIAVLEAQISDAVKKGAKLLVGGKSAGRGNAWFEPTVLADVSHDMIVMKDESFGPVIGVQKVASDAEAIRLMQDTEYGLTASVYTKEQSRAESILREMKTGSVYWNCCDRVSPFLPWSGRGHSGLGSTLSRLGILSFVQPKAWHMKTLR